MTVAELVAALAKLDPDIPVIMEMDGDPLGDYEVLHVRASEMECCIGNLDYPKVWDAPYDDTTGRPVAVLGYQPPPRRIVDVELPEPEAITR